MTTPDIVLMILFGALLTSLSPLVGRGLAVALAGSMPRFDTGVRRIFRLGEGGMTAGQYLAALLTLNALGLVAVLAILLLQGVLPGNPQGLPGVSWHLALNIAVSFVTNTNWQSYGGETTLSHFSQAVALGTQNFLSAATGIAGLLVLVRGLTRVQTTDVGDAWIDQARAVVLVLLPLSFIFALVLVQQGVPQTWAASFTAATPGGDQIIAVGPVASQEAIKQLGTNGGGFFNVNSAHPFENPTPLTNLLECLAILILPAALCFAFGRWVGDARQGRALFLVMLALFAVGVAATWWAEARPEPTLTALGVAPDGNWEGKEVRFGTGGSALWAVATTSASNGSVNAMHGSFTAWGQVAPLAMMALGEVVFGGIGSGLYGMILLVFVAVFVAGLMIGRTPEYLGKRLGPGEMRWVALGILAPTAIALLGAACAVVCADGRAGILNPGPRGFTEILYACLSAANNNGSACAGLSANTPFWNVLLSALMLVGRYAVLIPVVVLAGRFAAQAKLPASAGTLPTHAWSFNLLLMAVIVLVAALTYLPALVLGPVAEVLMPGAIP